MTAVADDRTNTLVVTAPSPSLKLIEGVINDLEKNPTQEQTFFIYNLRNGQATNLEPVLNTLFSGGGTNGSSGSRTGTSTTGNRTGTSGLASNSRSGNSGFGGSSGLGGSSSRGGTSGFGATGSSGGTGIGARRGSSSVGGGFAGLPGGLQLSPGSAASADSLVGQVFVVANPDTNSLLVTTATQVPATRCSRSSPSWTARSRRC